LPDEGEAVVGERVIGLPDEGLAVGAEDGLLHGLEEGLEGLAEEGRLVVVGRLVVEGRLVVAGFLDEGEADGLEGLKEGLAITGFVVGCLVGLRVRRLMIQPGGNAEGLRTEIGSGTVTEVSAVSPNA
jgi:hypothetical protein